MNHLKKPRKENTFPALIFALLLGALIAATILWLLETFMPAFNRDLKNAEDCWQVAHVFTSPTSDSDIYNAVKEYDVKISAAPNSRNAVLVSKGRTTLFVSKHSNGDASTGFQGSMSPIRDFTKVVIVIFSFLITFIAVFTAKTRKERW